MPRETVNFVAEGNIEIRGQKINCFLRDQSQSDLLYYLKCENGLETKISRTFVDFLHLGHEFSFISGHET